MTLAVHVLSGILMVLGSFFSLIGGIGLNRLPDFYTRSHACGMTDTLGAGLLLAGMMVYTLYPLDLAALIKLVTVLVFLVLTSPISSHAVTRAAWQSGLVPRLSTPLPEGITQPGGKKTEAGAAVGEDAP
jgi:multicomponent Na+:H+ antiporter subunit G